MIHQIDNKPKSFSQLCECFVKMKIFLLPSESVGDLGVGGPVVDGLVGGGFNKTLFK